jgi:hypothetical protein
LQEKDFAKELFRLSRFAFFVIGGCPSPGKWAYDNNDYSTVQQPSRSIMFIVDSSFIGDFSLGDNINHNLRVATLLYEHFATADTDKKRLLCKPIILTLVSVTEAMLHDLHVRIRTFTIEGVLNIPSEIVDYVRGKRIDELEKYIASARKHNLFDANDSTFYDSLDQLRRLRNRIHIQNTKGDFEEKEYNAFTDARKTLAEKVLEKTAKTMASKYPRDKHYVDPFEFPWKEHFPTTGL